MDNAFVVAKAECDQLLPQQLSGSSQPAAPKPPPSDDARAKLEDLKSERCWNLGEPHQIVLEDENEYILYSLFVLRRV